MAFFLILMMIKKFILHQIKIFLDTMDVSVYFVAMASQKKLVSFSEYWNVFRNEARDRGWPVAEFMRRCGLARQRYSEFDKGRSITGMYLNLLMEGTGLTQEQIEKRSGRKFTAEQVRERKIESWIAAHRDIIEAMVDDPGLIPIIKSIYEKRGK